MKNNKIFLALFIVCLCLSIFLSFNFISKQIVFEYDQGRDSLEAYTIWHDHHLKIQGPQSDFPGVYHGVLWYYALASAYALKNTPGFAVLFFATLIYLSIPLHVFITQSLFKNRTTTLISASLYSLSPLFLTATHWLSNTILAFIISPLLLISLWRFINHRGVMAALLSGIFYGLLIQSDIAWGLFLLTLPMILYVFRIRPNLKETMVFFVGLLATTSSFIIAETKFNGKSIISLLAYLSKIDLNSSNPGEVFLSIFNRIFSSINIIVIPVPYLILFGLTILVLKLLSKNRKQLVENRKALVFLTLWVGTILVYQLLPSGFSTGYYMLYPILGSSIILISFFLTTCLKPKPLLLLSGGIILSEVFQSVTWLSKNVTPDIVQTKMTYQIEQKVLDYTYESSGEKPFTITTITRPLFINTLWAALYQSYGLDKYGYMPFFEGRSQKGYLGNLEEKSFGTQYYYLIQEPEEGIPLVYLQKFIFEADKISDVIEEKQFGPVKVQKRLYNFKKGQPTPPSMLRTNLQVLYE